MNDFEVKILAKLRKDYRLKIEDANFAKGLIPVKILLDGTRNIHSYLVLCEKKENFLESSYWNKEDFDTNIKSMLSLQYSDLDRPLFFIYFENNKLMLIEGNDIRETILENPNLDIFEYMVNNSYKLSDVIFKIFKELKL